MVSSAVHVVCAGRVKPNIRRKGGLIKENRHWITRSYAHTMLYSHRLWKGSDLCLSHCDHSLEQHHSMLLRSMADRLHRMTFVIMLLILSAVFLYVQMILMIISLNHNLVVVVRNVSLDRLHRADCDLSL